ncbi:MAG TPA: methylated-DNA--[protein]-cysteine S-methyltransferase [Pararhizobium sp.]|nr:methylated-DNA--[protein]-cysteine S-methyltransferase [Pararhizobium sp.]
MHELAYTYLDTPIGPLLVAGDGDHLHTIGFARNGRPHPPAHDWRHDERPLTEALAELREYFDGTRTEFTVPLTFSGTPLEEAVWRAMACIPYGATTSYGAIAREIGEPPSASRAVGAAAGANPLPIVIPCHRVIGADGSLTGFGGGLETKSFLLSLERRVQPAPGAQLGLFD